MKCFLLAVTLTASVLPSLRAEDEQAFAAWQSGTLPVYFTYNGKQSDTITGWTRTEKSFPAESGTLHRYTFVDSATALKVVADVRTYNDFPAIDWVIHFTNQGRSDSPIIEDVRALNWSIPVQASPVVHWAQGSNAVPDDFAPHDGDLGAGKTVRLNSYGGRSSNNNLPFFNLQDGDHGVIGAIGWTGNWMAKIENVDGKSVTLTAAMQKTHFILHPGETVRTPRIVLLDWKGGRADSQNLWRQFVLAHYSPRQPNGRFVIPPASLGTWGSESVDDRKKTVDVINKFHVPLDVYWIDAGWYGNSDDWPHQRGNWTPNPKFFPPPDGMSAIGSYVHDNGLNFLLWLEAETADVNSDMLTKHPDWYLRTDLNSQALLNFGNPDALAGMTDFVSSLITSSSMAWYRQDFNVEPDAYWNKNDGQDRVGVTEMEDIDGLYKFWDGLRTAHPGLQIDNCASGGRRLDLEMISRGVSLWRSDLCCSPFDAIANQNMTQGLDVWVPLNSGDMGEFGGPTPQGTKDIEFAGTVPPTDAKFIYTARSAYSAGLTFGATRPPLTMLAPLLREFDQVRVFTTGDLYPLTPYSADAAAWFALQWHRPDLKAGVIAYLRRPNSADTAKSFPLHAIDPAAQYEVEVRTGFDPVPKQTMSGSDLTNLSVTINDKPGSTLVFYKQK